jgi:hypothetical protein
MVLPPNRIAAIPYCPNTILLQYRIAPIAYTIDRNAIDRNVVAVVNKNLFIFPNCNFIRIM